MDTKIKKQQVIFSLFFVYFEKVNVIIFVIHLRGEDLNDDLFAFLVNLSYSTFRMMFFFAPSIVKYISFF